MRHALRDIALALRLIEDLSGHLLGVVKEIGRLQADTLNNAESFTLVERRLTFLADRVHDLDGKRERESLRPRS